MSYVNSKPLGVLACSIVLTAISATILGAAIVWLVQRLHVEEEWMRDSVGNQIADILILAPRPETSQRGYLFTGRDVYLDNFNEAEKSLPLLVDETARLVADNLRQQETIAGLRQVVTDHDTRAAFYNRRAAGRARSRRARYPQFPTLA